MDVLGARAHLFLARKRGVLRVEYGAGAIDHCVRSVAATHEAGGSSHRQLVGQLRPGSSVGGGRSLAWIHTSSRLRCRRLTIGHTWTAQEELILLIDPRERLPGDEVRDAGRTVGFRRFQSVACTWLRIGRCSHAWIRLDCSSLPAAAISRAVELR